MTSPLPVIRPLTDTPAIRAMLADLLVETVASGGSVGFMHPMPAAMAEAFWESALTAAARGGRIIFGAWAGEVLAGTVTLLLDLPPNQPHRAEIAKMMTRVDHRKRGIATALLTAAEAAAAAAGRSLLVLDTAKDEGAAGLYERRGFRLAGEIPGYALKPHGGLTATLIYWKTIQGIPVQPDG